MGRRVWVPHPFPVLGKGAGFDFAFLSFLAPISFPLIHLITFP